jgi:PhoD-like phosphatase
MTNQFDRRSFLKKAGSTALGATALSLTQPVLGAPAQAEEISFRSVWPRGVSRQWPGPEYWANPLQDWRVQGGRLECINAGGDRNVALLTREVSGRRGDLTVSVRMGRLDAAALERGFAGFRVGIKSSQNNYRAAAIYGRGMNAGVSADGRLFIGALEDSAAEIDTGAELHLQLQAKPSAAGYAVLLRATNSRGESAEARKEVPADYLTGGLALVCSSGQITPTPVAAEPARDFDLYPPDQHRGGSMRFWFADWTIAGSKVDAHEDRAYGPILFTLYTVSRGTLKLAAQFPPLGGVDETAELQIDDGKGNWKHAATAPIDGDAWNATFRVPGWDATRAQRYRVVYAMPDALAGASGAAKQYAYEGVIRMEPQGGRDVVVGLLTCIWDLGFPHDDFTRHLAHHQPDVLFWTGDQIYEPVGGYGVIESRAAEMLEPAMLDFLRKWYIFGWSTRDLTRNIPSVCMTDDHDMYHGNIWGCGGRPTNPALGEQGYRGQDSGGYKMAPRWVNMVQRAQTSQLPDPADPAPVEQGIGVYYTHLLWGGVSFAVLEDRKWKSAPKQQLPGAEIQNGFALNPDWNTAVESNVPDAELLGQRQLDFLEGWARDWSGGTWMKFAVTQTLFGCLHTEPAAIHDDHEDPSETVPEPGVYLSGDHMVADHDSAGWPQRGRNEAILRWRKGFAAHLCGDQHLGTTSHYGVKDFRDGVYSVCTPAISNIFPRRWFPPQPGKNALPGKPNTGDHLDAFGNHMTVLAVANPAKYEGPGLEGLRYRVTGYTILTCNRSTRKTTIAEWPRWVDPSAPGAAPYEGWPITIDQIDNGLWGAEWQLDAIETSGIDEPVVQVEDEADGSVVYTLRIRGNSFTPPVRRPGTYAVVAYDPDGDYYKRWEHIQARKRS